MSDYYTHISKKGIHRSFADNYSTRIEPKTGLSYERLWLYFKEYETVLAPITITECINCKQGIYKNQVHCQFCNKQNLPCKYCDK